MKLVDYAATKEFCAFVFLMLAASLLLIPIDGKPVKILHNWAIGAREWETPQGRIVATYEGRDHTGRVVLKTPRGGRFKLLAGSLSNSDRMWLVRRQQQCGIERSRW